MFRDLAFCQRPTRSLSLGSAEFKASDYLPDFSVGWKTSCQKSVTGTLAVEASRRADPLPSTAAPGAHGGINGSGNYGLGCESDVW